MEKISNSKILLGVLYGIGIMLVLIIVFSVGVKVGVKKASFGINWQRNFEKNFGMISEKNDREKKMFLGIGRMEHENFPTAFGSMGKIINNTLPNLTIADKDGIEKIIVTNEKTIVHKMREEIELTELTTKDYIAVIGSPNDNGQIEAVLIRVVPEPDLLFKK